VLNTVHMFVVRILMYPHIRVVSEGSCDTEDWSNDDKFRNKLHFTVYSH